MRLTTFSIKSQILEYLVIVCLLYIYVVRGRHRLLYTIIICFSYFKNALFLCDKIALYDIKLLLDNHTIKRRSENSKKAINVSRAIKGPINGNVPRGYQIHEGGPSIFSLGFRWVRRFFHGV